MDIQYKAKNTGVSRAQQVAIMKRAADYRRTLHAYARKAPYGAPESSLGLPWDDEQLHAIENTLLYQNKKELRVIVVIGIGGSSLGTRAVYDALFGAYDVLTPARRPVIIFLESVIDEDLERVAAYIEHTCKSKREFCINLISKSGTTVESIMNIKILRVALEKKFRNIDRQLIITTDKDSHLYRDAQQRAIATLEIPQVVGGRFSILSTVGLFPLAAAGIPMHLLLAGARDILKQCLGGAITTDSALASAALQFVQRQRGNSIHDTFLFHRSLESLGKWYRQLLAESIGKNKNAAITPIISIGSTDLHSMAQLNFAKKKDMLTTFVSCTQSNVVQDAILQGTKIAYRRFGLPFMEVQLASVSPYELGQFLQWKMLEVMYLGQLSKVNTFDQPYVETYKSETRRILAQK